MVVPCRSMSKRAVPCRSLAVPSPTDSWPGLGRGKNVDDGAHECPASTRSLTHGPKPSWTCSDVPGRPPRRAGASWLSAFDLGPYPHCKSGRYLPLSVANGRHRSLGEGRGPAALRSAFSAVDLRPGLYTLLQIWTAEDRQGPRRTARDGEGRPTIPAADLVADGLPVLGDGPSHHLARKPHCKSCRWRSLAVSDGR